ncbi:universal stress protein [Puerhibacterium sp. TATVAM-FAB25]|uniref:universal stress protein n=1 Tax=Puerhibacterium sp. TATVAM-FAB25 TaxID=3093699 RepID=UPI00397A98F3
MDSTWTHGVVVGVDGSSDSRRALQWALGVAARHDAEVTAVCAYETPYAPSAPPVTGGNDDARAESRDAALRVLQQVAGVEEMRPDVELRLEPGSPAHVLVQHSRTADLVVVGHSGVSGFERFVLGSVSAATGAMARGPVAVVPPRARTGAPARVVVGVDPDGDPGAVLDLAFSEARAAGCMVQLVHVIAARTQDEAVAETRHYARLRRELAYDQMGDLLERWSEKYTDVDRAVAVRRGRPAEVLLDAVTPADVLVVGSRRHPVPAGRALGSVPDALIRTAPCPVVVVHPRTPLPRTDRVTEEEP